jgi:hypothetical protein
MTGFSYYRSPFERLAGLRRMPALDRSMLAALLAVAGALLLVAGVGAVEHTRLRTLDSDLAAMADRLTIARRDDARDDHLVASVAALRAIVHTIDDAHATTLEATNAIVRVGNTLPAQTWLTSVRGGSAGSWSFGGRSTHLDAIGTTLHTVAALDPTATAHLVSVTAAGPHARILDFTIALEQAP